VRAAGSARETGGRRRESGGVEASGRLCSEVADAEVSGEGPDDAF
jgi:hypothetical protein